MTDSGEIGLSLPEPADNIEQQGNGLPPRMSARLEGNDELGESDPAMLRVATSFDSEADCSDFNLTTEPLHSLSQAMGSSAIQSPLEATGTGAPFEVTDESDFEILPDDDDDREDAVDSAPMSSLQAIDDGKLSDQIEGGARASTNLSPATPPHSPSTSPSTSPQTPSRNFLSRFSGHRSPRTRKMPDGDDDDAAKNAADPKANRFRLFSNPGEVAPRSPAPNRFQAMRARAIAAYKGTEMPMVYTAEQSMGTDEWIQDDGSSSEESSFEDDMSSDDEFGIYDDVVDGMEHVIDFSSMNPMPTSFLDLPPDLFDHLHSGFVNTIEDQKIATFAQEHHLLVKGLLQLLAERDLVGVEDDVHDTSNIIKMGPLKKKSTRGIWSVKHVEIRTGNLTYFADNIKKDQSNSNTTIHLRKQTCRCISSKESSGNFMFELIVEGGKTKYFMAKSEEERQSWIRTINQAMVGETEGSIDAPVDLSLYQTPIEEYRSVQASLRQVETQRDYRVAVDGLLYRKSASSALRIPMSWIREEVIGKDEVKKERNAPHSRVKTSVSDFLKGLAGVSVDINGALIKANSVYSAERVVGSLSRCILEYDRVDGKRQRRDSSKSMRVAAKDSFVTELESVSYARSILAGILASSRRNDIEEAVSRLVENDQVATVELDSTEPLRVDVSFAEDDFNDTEEKHYDISGWVATRSKWKNVWKRRFFVISEGVLSYFEEAEPRPFGLRGQIALREASLRSVDERTIQIQTKSEDRVLRFEDRGHFVQWKSFLEKFSDQEPTIAPPQDIEGSTQTKTKKARRKSTGKSLGLKSATDTSEMVRKRAMKAMKGAKSAGMKKIKNARGMIKRGMGGSRHRRRRSGPSDKTQAMVMMSTRNIPQTPNQKRNPTVQAVIELNNVFKVLPVGGSRGEEPLLVVRVKLYQAFLLSGGANGRLWRGDELVEMEFVGSEDEDHEFLEAPTAL